MLGIGSALLAFLWGIVFSRTGAKTTLVEASLDYLIAFCALPPSMLSQVSVLSNGLQAKTRLPNVPGCDAYAQACSSTAA